MQAYTWEHWVTTGAWALARSIIAGALLCASSSIFGGTTEITAADSAMTPMQTQLEISGISFASKDRVIEYSLIGYEGLETWFKRFLCTYDGNKYIPAVLKNNRIEITIPKYTPIRRLRCDADGFMGRAAKYGSVAKVGLSLRASDPLITTYTELMVNGRSASWPTYSTPWTVSEGLTVSGVHLDVRKRGWTGKINYADHVILQASNRKEEVLHYVCTTGDCAPVRVLTNCIGDVCEDIGIDWGSGIRDMTSSRYAFMSPNDRGFVGLLDKTIKPGKRNGTLLVTVTAL